MTDPTLNGPDPTPPARFPFVTAAATVGVLFVFLALVVLAYRSPSFLDQPKPEADAKQEEPKPDPAARLAELNARNEAALNGVGGKTSLRAAHAELMGKLKAPTDKLPFPTPPPKDDKGKKP